MAVTSLQDDLLRIPGIEAAELEGDAEPPDGVRVRLGAGVDADAVGDEIRGVLAAHGLRSELSAGAAADVRETTGGGARASSAPPPPVPITAVPGVTSSLASIGVIESRDGVMVEATDSDGRRSVVRARSEPRSLDEAVVRAVAQLMSWEPAPLAISTSEHETDGSTVVTVVLEMGRLRVAGSAVVDGGRAYAVGRAVWAALSSV